MSDYTKIVDYAAKDALLTGNPAKLVKGTEIGAEFDAIATAVATKVDETGGAATNLTLTTPILGTPQSGTVTNLTGTASININGTVGATTPAAGAFTTLSASSTVSGTGFSAYLASPPAIGGTTPAAVAGTTGSFSGILGSNLALKAALAYSTTAGGDSAAGVIIGNVGQVGVYFGSGAPLITAGKGSLYLRTDGSTTNDRMYVNTNGSTTWTAVVTVD